MIIYAKSKPRYSKRMRNGKGLGSGEKTPLAKWVDRTLTGRLKSAPKKALLAGGKGKEERGDSVYRHNWEEIIHLSERDHTVKTSLWACFTRRKRVPGTWHNGNPVWDQHLTSQRDVVIIKGGNGGSIE